MGNRLFRQNFLARGSWFLSNSQWGLEHAILIFFQADTVWAFDCADTWFTLGLVKIGEGAIVIWLYVLLASWFVSKKDNHSHGTWTCSTWLTVCFCTYLIKIKCMDTFIFPLLCMTYLRCQLVNRGHYWHMLRPGFDGFLTCMC